MKLLVACERSQKVTKLARGQGHEAYSCDILSEYGGYPEWHIQDDVLKNLNRNWDMVLAFPPCTHLAVSGARWFKEKQKDGRQQQAIDFFMEFTKIKCPWAIENPIGIMSTYYQKPDQIIQPWQFGHGETKATCLWLNNLPLLKPTNIVSGRKSIVHYMSPSPERATKRSETYSGIAAAIVDQWIERKV